MTAKSGDSPGLTGKGGDKLEVAHDGSILATDDPQDLDVDARRRTVESYTSEEATRIMRKIDYRLVPLLAVLYLLAFIDRGNSKLGTLFCVHSVIGVFSPLGSCLNWHQHSGHLRSENRQRITV